MGGLALALTLTAITIAISWIAVRPVLAIILFAVAGADFYGLRALSKNDTHLAANTEN